MKTYQPTMAGQFRRLLELQEVRLREQLRGDHPELPTDTEAQGREVEDFKDVAEQEALDLVAQAQSNQAARDLVLVQRARERLDKGTYGICLECGEPVDLRRLEALPAVALCADCQQRQERVH